MSKVFLRLMLIFGALIIFPFSVLAQQEMISHNVSIYAPDGYPREESADWDEERDRQFYEENCTDCRYLGLFHKQEEINHPHRALLVNGVLVHTMQGVDMDSMNHVFSRPGPKYKRFRKNQFPYRGGQSFGRPECAEEYGPRMSDSLYEIEGKFYSSYKNFICKTYQPHWLSLADVRKKYASDVPYNKCLFMLNGYFLTTDLSRIRLDADYIDTVVVSRLGDMPSLGYHECFDVGLIQIQTRKMERYPSQLKMIDFGGNSLIFDPYNFSDVNFGSTIYLNGDRVQSVVGLNLDSLKTLLTPHKLNIRPYSIGKNAWSLSVPQYRPQLVSLKDLFLHYHPHSSYASQCLFIVNGIPIINKAEYVRLDADYVCGVRIYSPYEVERLSGGTFHNLYVALVYVKDKNFLARISDTLAWRDWDVNFVYKPEI